MFLGATITTHNDPSIVNEFQTTRTPQTLTLNSTQNNVKDDMSDSENYKAYE